MNSFFGNWRTTLFAFVAAMASQIAQVGFVWPSSGKDWGITLFNMAVVAWGAVSKDASVGSKAP